MFRWIRTFVVTVFHVLRVAFGLVALAAAIWFGFPMTERALLSEPWVRIGAIVAVTSAIGLLYFWRWYRRRMRAKALEASLVNDPGGDRRVLAARMQQALAKLKGSGGRSYLYDRPWYIIIGPPGAGKTTALENAEVSFPERDKLRDESGGFGGTRNCDWWFGEDAILIDTAGRYTTQDSDRAADKASWEAFLDLLKNGRPDQPINGVMLAFSVEDMMAEGGTGIARHAETVRARLAELQKAFAVDIPVYVLFTKADLIAGFREYFGTLNSSQRKRVWGVTFQTRNRKAPVVQTVPAEFDALMRRLSNGVTDRMHAETDAEARIAIFGLPGQMAMLRENVTGFLRDVFAAEQDTPEDKRKGRAILRGFYFTSGTQEGTPFDQVLGAMSRTGEGMAFQPSFLSGHGKSFFLHDLLQRVIFEERDWVRYDKLRAWRQGVLRTCAVMLIAGLSLGAMGAFGWSFWQNATLVRTVEAEADRYDTKARPVLAEAVIRDPDPEPVLGHLQDLRMITGGYGSRQPETPWEQLGLSQNGEVALAADRAYSDGLERMLRPRMILHLENEIPQLIEDKKQAGIYRALKVYMLLGGQGGGHGDDGAVLSYFADLYGAEFVEPAPLMAHVTAMLDLDRDRQVTLGIDPVIVENARVALAQEPYAERAFAEIKARAAQSGLPAFRLTGEGLDGVIEARDGATIDDLSVPALYTYAGFWDIFRGEVTAAQERMHADAWVLGDGSVPAANSAQLERDLLGMYQAEFVAAWGTMLESVRFAEMASDGPDYTVLQAASSTSSPLLMFAETVDAETRLTRASAQYDGLAEDEPVRSAAEAVSQAFAAWHKMLEGPENARGIDRMLQRLRTLWDNRRQAAATPGAGDGLTLAKTLLALKQDGADLPDPFQDELVAVAHAFSRAAEDEILAAFPQALKEEVGAFCARAIAPFFPFGSGPDLSLEDFSAFFGPHGRMARFFDLFLEPYVQSGSGRLVSTSDSALLSPELIAAFDQARAIERAFFSAGSAGPKVGMSIAHTASAPSGQAAKLHLHSSIPVETVPGAAGIRASWPGTASGIELEVLPPRADGRRRIKRYDAGPWDILRFLSEGLVAQDDNMIDLRPVVGGRTVTYRFVFDSGTVPFLMPELSGFSCPAHLE